jgi:hypothetical protein
MIRILDKPRLACITNRKVYVIIGTYYGYPLAVTLWEILTTKRPEELSKNMLTIFTEGKYYIPLTNYIRFSTIKGEKEFYKEKFWNEEEWNKFKSIWRILKQSIERKMIEDLYRYIFKYNVYAYNVHDDMIYKERKEMYFYFTKGFKMQSVYGSKTYRYHLGDPYFEILKHPRNPDQTIEKVPFFIDPDISIEKHNEDWFNTPQFEVMNKFMKIAKEIFDIDLSEEEDVIYE